jgi:anaerobic magnesium-protoporphyrin IX monomethyl ester cyclase
MAIDVLLINPPYVTLTSRVGVGHQVPLGLLMVGGALIDAGFSVGLVDAECRHLSLREVVVETKKKMPRVVMVGHAGSTPAHGVSVELMRAIKQQLPTVKAVYGGPFPTYHAAEILRGDGPAGLNRSSRGAVDVIVRGEGEATAVELVRAIFSGAPLTQVQSIAFLQMGEAGRGGTSSEVVVTPERSPLAMDDFRIGWELLDANGSWDAYQCFGLGRAVIVQLSRGCPHQCTYCGQRGFWMKWRHRDPVALVDELEWLATKRRVRFVTLADENPTTIPAVWHAFLEELAKRKLPLKFFATIRASDIVRDREFLPLWKEAGILHVLMGIDATDEATLKAIKKGSTTRVDYQACGLLRRHGNLSMIGHIVGLAHETPRDFWRAFKQVRLYDGDFLNVMYITPHAWTAFAETSRERTVADEQLSHWTYRRPVLGQMHLNPWQTFLCAKLLEFVYHFRPRRLWRFVSTDRFTRHQLRWTAYHMGFVWWAEIWTFIRDVPHGTGRTLAEFYRAALGECRHQDRVVSLRVRRDKARRLEEHEDSRSYGREIGV